MDRFRDKADEFIDQGQEQVDERTGGRFQEQTERLADAARQRLGGGQTEETEETEETSEEDLDAQAEQTQDTEPLDAEAEMDVEEEELDESGQPVDRLRSYGEEQQGRF